MIMKLRVFALLVSTHCVVGVASFGLGIYALLILTAPPAPSQSQVQELATHAQYSAVFRNDLEDRDALHWGACMVHLSPTTLTFMGKRAPVPDYPL